MFADWTAVERPHARALLPALALVVGMVGMLGPAVAQQPTPAALAAGKELATMKGADAMLHPVIAGVVERAKLTLLQTNPLLEREFNEVAAKLRAEYAARHTDLMNEVAKLYAARFTEQELKEVLAFYKSAAGRKLLAEEPRLVEQTMGAAQAWSNRLSDEVIARFRTEMRKRGHEI